MSEARAARPLHGVNATTGEKLQPAYPYASAADVDAACAAAERCFDTYREIAPAVRADFLERIATELEGRADALVQRGQLETALPAGRLQGELGRTTFQLRFFADWLRRGYWAGVRIDRPLPERKPAPRPELKLRQVPVGPVVVFGASNFPLAFSAAGGDVASALAAGCPVIVKAHSAHPGTSGLAAEAVLAAVRACGLPDGVYSHLYGEGADVGAALVRHPVVRAVGFTGSRRGGLALQALAQARPIPIPVYAEMSSINPVLVFPAALAQRAEQIARDYVASLTLGVGQFCTNPGLLLLPDSADAERFLTEAARTVAGVGAQTMLTSGIQKAFTEGVDALAAQPVVRTLATGAATVAGAATAGDSAPGTPQAQASLHSVSAADFLRTPALQHEMFGPAGLIVRCSSVADFRAVIAAVEGQLTIALHLDDADHADAAALLPLLETRAGRILVNGFGTGVEVAHAMVHGGPYPSTSDTRTTSVGSLAIERFLRPVSYQNLPDALLPAALKAANPHHLPRLVDGTLEVP